MGRNVSRFIALLIISAVSLVVVLSSFADTKFVPGYPYLINYQFNVTGATDDGRAVAPTNRPKSDTFQVPSVAIRTYTPAGRTCEIWRVAVTAADDLTIAATEICTMRVYVNGVANTTADIAAGEGQTPICDPDHTLTGTDLNAVGEGCTRTDFAPISVPAGSYWAIRSMDGNGVNSCLAFSSAALEVSLRCR